MSAVSITNTKLAAACPAPQAASGYLDLVAAYAGTPVAPVSPSVQPSDSSAMVSKLTLLAAIVDSNARYGGGGVYGVQNGLVPAGDTTGLTLTIGQGQAMIDGPAQVPSGGITYALPLSSSAIYVWGLRGANGVLSVTHTTTTTPPTTPCCLLCICATSGTGITAIDLSGVVYTHSGFPIRNTADTAMPADSPPAGILVMTKTLLNTYLWDGVSHHPLGIPLVASDPSTPQTGDVWYNTASHALKVRESGSTKSVTLS